MTTDLILIEPALPAVGELAQLSERAKSFARSAMAPSTVRAYGVKWLAWADHCRQHGLTSLPADPVAVANWLSERAVTGKTSGRRARSTAQGQALSTLRLAVAAIKAAHSSGGLGFDTGHPAITQVLRGISRENAELASQAEPMRASLILAVIEALDPNCPIAARDAAALALGYMFGRRRSELVGLDLERLGSGEGKGDGILKRDVQALEVVLLRHKTSDGSGTPKHFVAPRANNEVAVGVIERWLTLAQVRPGEPVLRRIHKGGRIGSERLSGTSISSIVKARVAQHFIAKNGVAPDFAVEQAFAYSGHSLRTGLAVTSAEAGADVRAIQTILGHASPAMAIRYAAKADAMKTSVHNLPGVGLGRQK